MPAIGRKRWYASFASATCKCRWHFTWREKKRAPFVRPHAGNRLAYDSIITGTIPTSYAILDEVSEAAVVTIF